MDLLIAIILTAIIVAIGVPIANAHEEKKKKRQEERARNNPKVRELRRFQALANKKDLYLSLLRESDDYVILSELFKRYPTYYNAYASSILNAPLALSKPASPYTAGALASAIGGTALGVAAVLDAKEKEQKYKENVKAIIASQIETGNAHDKINNCYLSIESIIKSNKEARMDWEKELASL